MTFANQTVDNASEAFLGRMEREEKVRKNKIDGVKTILVVLSGRSQIFDNQSLKHLIGMTYPGAKIYLASTLGIPVGEAAPANVDLVLDFTGPGHRHKWFLARKLRANSGFLVGRPAGFFRKHIYNRVFDEKQDPNLPRDVFDRERYVQTRVLEMAGIPVAQRGDPGADLSKEIALDLPPLKKR